MPPSLSKFPQIDTGRSNTSPASGAASANHAFPWELLQVGAQGFHLSGQGGIVPDPAPKHTGTLCTARSGLLTNHPATC